jgi:uncharacterized OB-fold protein
MINKDVVKGMLTLKNEVLEVGDQQVLLTPRMFGVPQMVTAGEQSRWLLPMWKEAKLVGARCPKCGQVYAPAYVEYCGYAPCRMAKLELIDLPDTGVIAGGDPVITLFAPARMHGKAPFAHGLVYLKNDKIDATVAMMFALQTTRGVIQPGIFKAGTKVKVVFKDDKDREGWVRDMFCLPQKELSKTQLKKSPLFASDIDWSEPKPPKYPKNPKQAKALPKILGAVATFFDGVNRSPRNRARLKAVNFTVNVYTGGGNFAFGVKKGVIQLLPKTVGKPTTSIAVKNPAVFKGWTTGKALTNLFALGELWLANREGIRVLEDLDRLWRAAFRDGTL